MTRVELIGVPYDASSSFLRGCAAGPAAVRAALMSESSNAFSECGRNVLELLEDGGDLSLPDDTSALERIESHVKTRVAGGSVLAIGGDHAIAWPLVRAQAAHHSDLTIVQIDAHPDLYDELDGSRASHACPFARIMEEGLVRRLIQIGIRCHTPHQREQARRFGVELIDMPAWSAGARPAFDGPVYVSLDLDGLDPAFVPGVSHHEPGGLTTREVITLIQQIDVPVIGADVVELNPSRDVNGVTAMVAAKLVKELVAKIAGEALGHEI